MNALLWVLQIALAWFCIAGGAYQIFKIDELAVGVAAMRELPHALWQILGASSCVTGIGLLLPSAVNMRSRLTALAAAIICAQSMLVSVLYGLYGDHAPLPFSATMAILAGFIGYGRFTRAQSPSSQS